MRCSIWSSGFPVNIIIALKRRAITIALPVGCKPVINDLKVRNNLILPLRDALQAIYATHAAY